MLPNIKTIRIRLLSALTIFVAATLPADERSDTDLQWESLFIAPDVDYFRGIDSINHGQTLWVAGSNGSVFKSDDGGATWRPTTSPGDIAASGIGLRDIELLGDDVAVTISSGPGGASRIYRTDDGGVSWDLAHVNEYETGYFNAMAWWDRENGIVFSDPVDGRVHVLQTGDGGRTWRELNTNGESLVAVADEYGFAASGTCVESAPGGFAWILTANSKESRVHVTRDYGATWNLSRPPIPVANSSSGPFASALWDDRRGIVVGGDFENRTGRYANVALTDDGGRSWRRPRNYPHGHRSSVVYVTEQIIVAIGSHGTDYSIDGGMNWTKISDHGYYAAVAFDRTVWAAGSEGRIAKLNLNRIR